MTTVVVAVVLFGVVTGLFFWQRLLRSQRARASWALWASSLFLALALSMQIPSVHNAFAYETDWNLFWPTQWALTITCCLMVHVFAIRVAATNWRHARRAICRTTVVMAVPFLCACALFATSPHDPDFVLGPQSRLESPAPVAIPIGMAWVFVMTIIGVSGWTHGVRTWRWATKARRPHQAWLQIGLSVTSVGFFVGVAYCLHSAGYQIALASDVIPSWTQRSVSDPLILAAPTLIFTGSVLPAIGSWHRERREGVQLLQRLAPITRLLATELPSPHFLALRQRTARQWRPTIYVYQHLIAFADVYLRVQQEIPPSLLQFALRGTEGRELDADRQQAAVIAAVFALWDAIRDPAADENAVAERASRILPERVTHLDPLKVNGYRRKSTLLLADLDRWLLAADILRDFPVAADRHARCGQSH
jgi:hypothetical protein